MKKVISVLLAVLVLLSIMVPVAMAEEEKTTSEHADFSEVLDVITDDEGEVDWKKLPGSYLKIFAKIRFIEVIWNFFNMLFGGALNDLFNGLVGGGSSAAAEPTTVAAEPTAEPATA